MKNKFFSFLLASLIPSSFFLPSVEAVSPSALSSAMPSEIVVHNRILAKVNGKIISVLDVMKKMDLSFYRQYPDLSSSTIARYQYYMSGWQTILAGMIDDELIIADAAEKKVEITDGDIREEMEALFGPNVVLNIDKVGLTFDEAWEMLKKELLVRRMTMFMVRSKANHQVHPKKVRQLYEDFAKQTQVDSEWHYRVLTVRSENEEKSNQVATIAYKLLEEEKIPFEKIADRLKDEGFLNEEVVLTVSEEYQRKDKELALAHRAILQTLHIGSHSAPIIQTVKNGNATVNRIFYLAEKIAGKVQSFKELEDKFKKELTQKALVKESEIYLKKLRRHFGVTDKYLSDMNPDKFAPFSLQ